MTTVTFSFADHSHFVFLKGYPPRKGWSLVSDNDEAYAHVKEQQSENKSGKENVVVSVSLMLLEIDFASTSCCIIC